MLITNGVLTSNSGASSRNTPASSATNRLTGTGTTYAAAGNLTTWNSAIYTYDRFNQMIRMRSGSEDLVYLHTAGDERLWTFEVGKNQSRWTLRDLSGKVLRDYFNDGTWTIDTDYLYRDAQLLAAETRLGRRHFHLDHLGTPRLITNGAGYPVAYHVDYPFGEEATAFNQDRERMKFTGHERDLASPAGAGDDLDYMHARHCSPVTGRFLGTDPSSSPWQKSFWLKPATDSKGLTGTKSALKVLLPRAASGRTSSRRRGNVGIWHLSWCPHLGELDASYYYFFCPFQLV